MRRRLVEAAICAAVIWAGSAPLTAAQQAVSVDMATGDIFAACQRGESFFDGHGTAQEVVDGGVCVGYLFGVLQAGAVKGTCSEPATMETFARILTAYVKRFPVWRTRHPIDAFKAALQDAFPCPAPSP